MIDDAARGLIPGPWNLVWWGHEQYPYPLSILTDDDGMWVARGGTVSSQANARTLAAAWDLLRAARLQEAAELANANCPECEGEIVPETCPLCFPLFDEARCARQLALAKAEVMVADR